MDNVQKTNNGILLSRLTNNENTKNEMVARIITGKRDRVKIRLLKKVKLSL
jgi:hypothetical protein